MTADLKIWRNRLMQSFLTLLTGMHIAYALPNIEADVFVYESTPSGIMAAITAADAGRRVVMLSPYQHVGGMRTSGLSMSNINNTALFGGLGKEFHKRVFRYYTEKYGVHSQQAKDADEGFRFEPHVAEKVFLDWLLDAGVEILGQERVISVQKNGKSIVSVRTDRNRRIKARLFIDASYEGDLLAMAGVSYRIGRESREEYGEMFAGMTLPPDHKGRRSDKIQRYVYRLVLTDSVENQVPIRKPANYHRASFMIDAALLEHTPPASLSRVLALNRIPNRKTDVRVGEGWLGGSHYWPEATPEERAVIALEHREYAEGYLWFLLNDKSVPPEVRRELRKWGYARDEFTDNENWPYQLYVREARRMVGDYVMTELDILQNRFKPDGVAIGDFMLDIHPVQYVPLSGETGGFYSKAAIVAKEGGVDHAVKPYEIPFRSLLPKEKEADNLMVTVCISATNIAFSSVRMEPVYMMLGHAAGVAAVLSLESGTGLHRLSTADIRRRLSGQGAVLDAKLF